MGSTAEQRGYYFNDGRRIAEQHLPGRRSTQGRLENEDWNFNASQPSNFGESPSTQNDSSCTQSSVAGWAVRPKLQKSATSGGPRTEELPKASTTKSKTQWKTLEVDLHLPAPVQQQQIPPRFNSTANNAWAARNQPKKSSEYPSLNSHQHSEEELQVEQDALLALKLQEEEEKLAAAWQRGSKKKQAVHQTSEAFPALQPPPSVLQGENTPTSKPQENADAQKQVFTISSVQHINPPANVAKSSMPLTGKQTLAVNEGVESGHDDVEEVFESDEDLGSDNEEQTHSGGFEVNGQSKKAFLNRNLAHYPKRDGAATSATFSNRNIVNRPESTATSTAFPNRKFANPEKINTTTSANFPKRPENTATSAAFPNRNFPNRPESTATSVSFPNRPENTATSAAFPNQNFANSEKINTATSVNLPNRNLANRRENTATSAAFPNRNLANPEKASTATSVSFPNHPENTATSAAFPNRNLANPEKASTAASVNFPNRNVANPKKANIATSPTFPNQNFANRETIGPANSVNFPNLANRPENTATSAAFPNRNLANPEKASTATSPTFPNQNFADREKIVTATSVNFPNGNLANPVVTYPDRNLPNNQQQFTASVTSISSPQAQSEFHSEGLVNQMSKKSESVLKSTTNSPTPAVAAPVVIPMQQVMQPNPTDVLYLAEHIACVRAKTENAHCVAKEAQEQWGKIETLGFKIEESFGSLHNANTMGMPVLQDNIMSALHALRASLSVGLTKAKAYVQRYAGEPLNPTQNEPILMSLPGGGTAVMMRPTSAPTTPQRHPLVVDAFSLGMTAVNLFRKIREEWAGTNPVSSASETKVLNCKEKVEALQRQQNPQHIQNLLSEVCCDALFICHLALDMVAHSRKLPNAP